MLFMAALPYPVAGQIMSGQDATEAWPIASDNGLIISDNGPVAAIIAQEPPEVTQVSSASVQQHATFQDPVYDPCWDSLTFFDDFFDKEEPLHLILKFDLKTMQRTRVEEPYLDAKLYCNINDTCQIPYEVEIRTRGIFRKSYCYLPPFWMKIEKSSIESSALDGVKKIKIVTHCMRRDFYQDYLLKEYLAYKIYNIISPYSFRVRLMRVTYIDTGRNNKTIEGWAFAIEPKEMLAERINGTCIDDEELAMRHMQPGIMDHLAMFNYMIGNTDYSITGTHNVKIFRVKQNGLESYIPVPYDFDFTGIVNTVYAKPAAQAPISEVTQRYYTGLCRSEEIQRKVIAEFRGYSPEIHDLLQSFQYMDLDEKLEMLSFIEQFFDEVSREQQLLRNINTSCK